MREQSIGRNTRGFATLEVLLAFTLVILCVAAVIIVCFGNQLITSDSEMSIIARSKAQKMLEDARALSRKDFSLVSSSGTIADDIYQKTLTVEDVDDYTKKITSNVAWNTEGGRNPFVKFITLVTNPSGVCGQTLVGDWANPKIINTSSVDLDPTSTLTDIDATNGYTYVVSDASASSKNDFYIVKTSDPALPAILASLNTGPGLNAISVNGNYAYVANSSINSQLQVIDITNKNSPTLYKSFKLPIADSDVGTVGHSILYSGGKVYLGTKKNGKSGLHIIDVSDLSNIKEVGYLEVNNTINQIKIIGNYAYIASADNSAELRVLNISNPTNITNVSSYNATGTTGFGFGNSLAVSGSSLFLGRTFDSNPSVKELYVLDITNPNTNPLPSTSSQEISDSVNDLLVKNNLIFLANNAQFQVRKISDLSLYGTIPLTTNSASMDCSGNLIYLGVQGDASGTHKNVLKIIGSSP